MIDLSKRLWHDAPRMSFKETFARDGFVGDQGVFGTNLAATAPAPSAYRRHPTHHRAALSTGW
jgi:hypothetical protein